MKVGELRKVQCAICSRNIRVRISSERRTSWGSSGLKCEPLGFLAICPSHWLSSPSAFQGGSRLRSTALSRNVERGAVMASVTIDVDLPPGVEITGYERHQDGHGFEVRWPLPERCCCQRCGHEDTAHIEFKTTPQVIRDLNVWGQPSFWISQAPFHRCARCDHRQHIIPPFK